MTALDDRPAVTDAEQMDVAEALGRINLAMDGLRNLAALIQARPDIAPLIRLRGHDINVFVGDHCGEGKDVPDRIASLAEDAAEAGATVTQRHSGEYGGIEAMFGPFPLHVYARLSQVGKATTRTVEVVDWQPHAALAAFPKEAER